MRFYGLRASHPTKIKERTTLLVKIQQRKAKRPYLNSKNIYLYDRRTVCIIKEHHLLSEPFLKQKLNETVRVENGSLIIVLTPKQQPNTQSSQAFPSRGTLQKRPPQHEL